MNVWVWLVNTHIHPLCVEYTLTIVWYKYKSCPHIFSAFIPTYFTFFALKMFFLLAYNSVILVDTLQLTEAFSMNLEL